MTTTPSGNLEQDRPQHTAFATSTEVMEVSSPQPGGPTTGGVADDDRVHRRNQAHPRGRGHTVEVVPALAVPSRTRTALPAERMTTTPPVMVIQVSCSPSSRPAQQIDSTGWTSCTWLTWAIGPSARPWYQAKKPRNMLTMPR